MTARRCVGSTCGPWEGGAAVRQAQRRITGAGANVSVTSVQPKSHKYEACRGVPLPVCMSLSAPHSHAHRIIIERYKGGADGKAWKGKGYRVPILPAAPLHRTTEYLTRPQKSFSTVVVNEIVRSHVHLLAEPMLAWITPDFAISLKKPPHIVHYVIDFPQFSLPPPLHFSLLGFYSSRLRSHWLTLRIQLLYSAICRSITGERTCS